jgi:hypothetical protein
MHSSLRLANRQFDADYLNFSLVYTVILAGLTLIAPAMDLNY